MASYTYNTQTLNLPANSAIASCTYNAGLINVGNNSSIQTVMYNSANIVMGDNCEISTLMYNSGHIRLGENSKVSSVSFNTGTIVAGEGSTIEPGNFNKGTISIGDIPANTTSGAGDQFVSGFPSMNLNTMFPPGGMGFVNTDGITNFVNGMTEAAQTMVNGMNMQMQGPRTTIVDANGNIINVFNNAQTTGSFTMGNSFSVMGNCNTTTVVTTVRGENGGQMSQNTVISIGNGGTEGIDTFNPNTDAPIQITETNEEGVNVENANVSGGEVIVNEEVVEVGEEGNVVEDNLEVNNELNAAENITEGTASNMSIDASTD